MKVLVAGGAGFVGNHLCRRLVQDGHEVVCVDNLVTGAKSNVIDLLASEHFRWVDADVATAPDMQVDAVYHLASPASPVDYDRLPLETMWANAEGTRRLLEIATASSASLLYVSTSEVYGDPLVHPQPEEYWGNVDPIGPRSCYDEGKRFGEALVTSWRAVHRVRAALVRVFNTYGPKMRMNDGRVIPALLAEVRQGRPLTIHGGGQQTRSFMYVDDLVEALVLVGLDPDLDGLVLNIGNPDEVTVAELARRILTVVGEDRPIDHVAGRPGDPQRRRPDITRISERYGWRPTVDLDEGLRRTVQWYADEVTANDIDHRAVERPVPL